MAEFTPVDIPAISRLREIGSVLILARTNPHYVRGTPDAIDHLATHVVAALEDIDARLTALEARTAA